MLTGLPPIATPDARALILGSFPSPISRREKQYYANPQNQFWRIIEALFQIPHDGAYDQRCAQLKKHRIAVWDVLAKCQIDGAMDATIRDPEANDFANFYHCHPQIKAVFWNGAAAEHHYKKLTGEPPTYIAHRLLSTSPANARYTLPEKINQWQAVRDALEG